MLLLLLLCTSVCPTFVQAHQWEILQCWNITFLIFLLMLRMANISFQLTVSGNIFTAVVDMLLSVSWLVLLLSLLLLFRRFCKVACLYNVCVYVHCLVSVVDRWTQLTPSHHRFVSCTLHTSTNWSVKWRPGTPVSFSFIEIFDCSYGRKYPFCFPHIG